MSMNGFTAASAWATIQATWVRPNPKVDPKKLPSFNLERSARLLMTARVLVVSIAVVYGSIVSYSHGTKWFLVFLAYLGVNVLLLAPFIKAARRPRIYAAAALDAASVFFAILPVFWPAAPVAVPMLLWCLVENAEENLIEWRQILNASRVAA